MTHGKKSATVTPSIGSNNTWFAAAVKTVTVESPHVKTFTFTAPHPIHNLAGQHFELRLTAENGYQAARLYSAATANNGTPSITLTIMDVPDGEVSPYLTHNLAVGDQVELRGPFGKFFVWSENVTEPVLLIGGGSGVVPMHAFLSAHKETDSSQPMHLIYSARRYEDILYKDEFINNPRVTITLTQEVPSTWDGQAGRITPELIKRQLDTFNSAPLCYICGMTSFVDAMTKALQSFGVPAGRIKTERFG